MSFTIYKDKIIGYEDVESDKKKAGISRLLTIAKALTQKAGARHSSKDSGMVQKMHDLACELGAKCDVQKATSDYFSKPAMKADVADVMVLRHPGHGSQRVHGHRHGSTGGNGGSVESAKKTFSERAAKLGQKNVTYKQDKDGSLNVFSNGKKTKIKITPDGRIISFSGGKPAMEMTDAGWKKI